MAQRQLRLLFSWALWVHLHLGHKLPCLALIVVVVAAAAMLRVLDG